jgi:hypothetical protein
VCTVKTGYLYIYMYSKRNLRIVKTIDITFTRQHTATLPPQATLDDTAGDRVSFELFWIDLGWVVLEGKYMPPSSTVDLYCVLDNKDHKNCFPSSTCDRVVEEDTQRITASIRRGCISNNVDYHERVTQVRMPGIPNREGVVE